jgi:hypothetical protein
MPNLYSPVARRIPILVVTLLMLATGLTAQNAEDRPTSLDDLAWLVGRWQGEGFGGVIEETWFPAEAGSMMGTFRLAHDGEVAFYEFMTITIEDGSPLLRLKHFNADMTGWETKDEVITFVTRYVKPDEVGFDGLTYRLTSKDSLTIVVHTEGHGETTLKCRRVGGDI